MAAIKSRSGEPLPGDVVPLRPRTAPMRRPVSPRRTRRSTWSVCRVVLGIAFASMAAPLVASAGPLRDAPVIWYDTDAADIPQPEERDPDLYWDQYVDAFALPIARFFNPVRAVRRARYDLWRPSRRPRAERQRARRSPQLDVVHQSHRDV